MNSRRTSLSNKTPPQLRDNLPPILAGENILVQDADERVATRSIPKGDTPLAGSYPASKLLLAIAIIVGIAAGRIIDVWRGLSGGDADAPVLSYALIAFACFGSGGLGFFWWYVVRRPSLASFLGMARPFWFVGMPLAWLCGLVIGSLWQLV